MSRKKKCYCIHLVFWFIYKLQLETVFLNHFYMNVKKNKCHDFAVNLRCIYYIVKIFTDKPFKANIVFYH